MGHLGPSGRVYCVGISFLPVGFALSHRLKNCELFEIAGLVRNRGVSENVVPTAAEYIVAAAAGKW